MRWLPAVLFLILACPTVGQVYRCERNGEIIFSQQPCGADAAEIDLNVAQPPTDSVRETQRRAARDRAAAKAWRSERQAGRQIREAQEALDRAKQQRDRELAAIARRRAEVYENFAGSELEAEAARQLEQDRQAILTRYKAVTGGLREKIDRLRRDQ